MSNLEGLNAPGASETKDVDAEPPSKRHRKELVQDDGTRQKPNSFDCLFWLQAFTGNLGKDNEAVEINLNVFGTYQEPWFIAAEVEAALGVVTNKMTENCQQMNGDYAQRDKVYTYITVIWLQ
jgi:hypothetical protein